MLRSRPLCRAESNVGSKMHAQTLLLGAAPRVRTPTGMTSLRPFRRDRTFPLRIAPIGLTDDAPHHAVPNAIDSSHAYGSLNHRDKSMQRLRK